MSTPFKISAKTTKAEIVEELRRLETLLQEGHKSSETIASVQETKRIDKVKEVAAEVIGLNILNEETVEKYKAVKEAIALATTELQEILGTKDELISLETVKNLKSTVISDLEAEITAKKEELKALEDQIIEDAKVAKELLAAELKTGRAENAKILAEEAVEAKKKRDRENEEYNYTTKRNRDLDNDKWNDTKAAREKAMADKELELEARITAVAAREEAIEALEAKVAEIPTLIEEAVAVAVTKEKNAQKASEAIADKYRAKEKESMEALHTTKLENLSANLEAYKAQVIDLNAKLEKAYAANAELATKAVTAGSTIKVIESGNGNK
jgi:hypothetical protein